MLSTLGTLKRHTAVARVAVLWFAAFAMPLHAACSRDILVPVANIGLAVVVDGVAVSGVYPDVLRELGAKADCMFNFVEFPRARSDAMFFERGTSDLVIPASYTPERAQVATFVALVKVLPTLVATKELPGRIRTVKQLLENPQLRGVVVRSFTFGTEYQNLIAELAKAGRVDFVPDIKTVARMLVAERVDFTIVAPHLVHTALSGEDFDPDAAKSLRSYPLDGLPRVDSGVYISQRSLSVADHDALVALFSRAAKTDTFIKAHQKHYRPEVLQGIITRP